MITACEIFHKGFTFEFPSCAECTVCTGAPAAEDILIGSEPALFSVSLMSNQDISTICGVSVSGNSYNSPTGLTCEVSRPHDQVQLFFLSLSCILSITDHSWINSYWIGKYIYKSMCCIPTKVRTMIHTHIKTQQSIYPKHQQLAPKKLTF